MYRETAHPCPRRQYELLFALPAAAVWCADTDQKSALAKSHFALLWRRAVQHNPFIQAFMLNFGAIGEA
jgi:hypothetical protein